MGEVTGKLVSFITKTQFSDLPQDVTYETKRVLLDSIGCAINGLSTDTGRIAVELARRLGGPPESTVIGTSNKVSCANAAFANGELMNALDCDAIIAGHAACPVVAASLALMESTQASGKNLVLAIALGHEIAERVASASGNAFGVLTTIGDGFERGAVKWADVSGWSTTTFGAAAAAGRILNLNQEKMANAIGLAGYLCMPNTFRKFMDVTPIRMSKYGLLGWGAHAGVISALLAEMGFTGDTDVFEGEHCFWEYTGLRDWSAQRVVENLSSEWRHRINYKKYPIGYCLPGAVDSFIHIIEQNNLRPEDIQEVKVRVMPVIGFAFQRDNKLRTKDDECFNGRYAIACAANRIDPAHWHDPEVRQDPGIREFLEKIEISMDEKEWGLARLEDPRATAMEAEVVAEGGTFTEKTKFIKGQHGPEEFRLTNDELIEKFTSNALRVLPLDKANMVVQTVLELEKLENAAQLMELVIP